MEIFQKWIPDILIKDAPDNSYVHSSPLGSQFNFLSGDVHYWTVWWGGSAIEEYENRIGLFNSEFGMQSLLPMSSLRSFLDEDDLGAENTPALLYRNKMRGGSDTVDRYVR